MSSRIFAQTPYDVQLLPSTVANEISINKGSAALWQSLKKLHTRASLIMLTAHPDDEDGGMLTYESRGRGTRVSLLTLNRGEGGANVMSPDFFDALGLVRTQELLAADRYYGVDQYWTIATPNMLVLVPVGKKPGFLMLTPDERSRLKISVW